MIGNFDYLSAKTPVDGHVHKILEHFIKNGEQLCFQFESPGDKKNEAVEVQDLHPGQENMFNEISFFNVFEMDLKRAKDSVVIFSPFITARGASRWVEIFRELHNRSVKIRLLVQPPEIENEEAWEIISELLKLGLVVDLREKMHQKIAVIDDFVGWHGSLNILSHRDTHELMIRVKSRAFCEEVKTMVSLKARQNQNQPELFDRENVDCPICKGLTIRHESYNGIYFKCISPACKGFVDMRYYRSTNKPDKKSSVVYAADNAPPSAIKRQATCLKFACPVPGCNGELVLRNSHYGQFYGCSEYPRCRHTEKK